MVDHILDHEPKPEQDIKAPRFMLVFLLALFPMASSIYKNLSLYLDLRNLPQREVFQILDSILFSVDFLEQLILIPVFFIGVLISLNLSNKYRKKITARKEWAIILMPIILLVIYLILHFILTEITYNLI